MDDKHLGPSKDDRCFFRIDLMEDKEMKDRINPCIHYVCKGEDCKKGFVKVDLKKCKNCPKYEPRKSTKKAEPVRSRRQKDRDRHDDW